MAQASATMVRSTDFNRRIRKLEALSFAQRAIAVHITWAIHLGVCNDPNHSPLIHPQALTNVA